MVPNHDGVSDNRSSPFRYYGGKTNTERVLLESSHYQAVKQFALLAGNQVPDKPQDLSPKDAELCARLILEEAMETIHALGVDIRIKAECDRYAPVSFGCFSLQAVRPMDLVEVIDGICDTHVVSTFTQVLCGVTGVEVQNAVDRNNLDKFDPALGGYRCEVTGKWIKPKNHPKPPIAEILVAQGWNPPVPVGQEGC